MINKKQIKDIAQKFSKKIGKKAIEKIDRIAADFAENLISGASRKADISGRSTIKEEDIS
ncbi:MAG: histone-like protein [Nanoarchaeota archaeon]